MSWLLTEPEFADAANAVREGRVTEPLFSFVEGLVRVVAATRTLPPSLSTTGEWDGDGIEETVAEWWADRLLEGTMASAFDSCADPRSLSRFLEASLRNWLIDRARRTQQPRLLARANELLRSEPETFSSIGSGGSALDAQWGLSAWESPPPFQGSTRELLGEVFALGDFELLRFGDQARKAEPVISNVDLRRLVVGLLERTECLLTLRQFDAVLRARFPEAFASSAPVAELPDSASHEAPVSDQVEARAVAREIIARLSARQTKMLVERFRLSCTLEELATTHGCSRGTADNEIRRATVVLREGLSSDDDQALVLKTLLDLASED